jgi:N6-L-threonylcarbamoyladenine synthase
MLDSGDLAMSFSGLKTAVLTCVRRLEAAGRFDDTARADIACEFEAAVADVLTAKAMGALTVTGRDQLVVAGGVGANRRLRECLSATAARRGAHVFYPDLAFCTDNGAMIALAGALRLGAVRGTEDAAFGVKPRWDLASLRAP